MQNLIITAVGPDRPGLVGEFTGVLLDAGANVGDSRMVNLRGQFALMIHVELPDSPAPGGADAIRQKLIDAGKKLGLTVTLPPAGTGLGPARAVAGVPYKLKTYAMDQPGIVHKITHILKQHGVNIEELQTHLESAAHSGTPLFTMELRMTVPNTVAIKKLRSELEALCDQLNCDMDVEPA